MNETILLVEDGPDDVLFMQRALAKAQLPHDLRVVVDGRQAIAYLSGEDKYSNRSAFPLPRLVLLDLSLPYLSGFEVLGFDPPTDHPEQSFSHCPDIVRSPIRHPPGI